MNPIVTDFMKFLAREIAAQVAHHLAALGPAVTTAQAEEIAKADTFKADVTAERSESEWRADCLAIINEIAPTCGPQLRALFPKFDGAKRLPEVKAADLPALLAELVMLKDAH